MTDTPGSVTNSEKFAVGNHPATLTLDDTAFPCQIADRSNGRSQTIIRGTLSGKGYKTGGIPCDLTKLTSPGKFPLGNYRVIVQPNSTAVYYAVYDHAAKKVLIFSGLSAEIASGTDISALVFPFLAVGE